MFRLTVTDNNTGCVSAQEDLATVVVNGGPLSVTADVTDPMICRSAMTQLHALPSGGYPDYTFSWTSSPPGFTSTQQEPYVYPTENTTYTVEVFDGYNNFTSQPVLVTVSSPPFVNLGADLNVCPYDTVRLVANNPGMNYYWSNGSIEQSILVGTTGIGFDFKTIWVRVENDDGCMSTDTIKIVFDFAECSGVEEHDQETDVFLYPNPTTGKVLIEWTGLSGNVDMQITDLHGTKIMGQAIIAPSSGQYKGSFDLSGVIVRKIVLQ
jgi:hypothetical protein